MWKPGDRVTHRFHDELGTGRIAEIRGRILQGAYNSVEIVDQVARKMLERGDI